MKIRWIPQIFHRIFDSRTLRKIAWETINTDSISYSAVDLDKKETARFSTSKKPSPVTGRYPSGFLQNCSNRFRSHFAGSPSGFVPPNRRDRSQTNHHLLGLPVSGKIDLISDPGNGHEMFIVETFASLRF